MKIALINHVFPNGSTGKIIKDLEKQYSSDGINSIVIFGHGKASSKNHFKICNTLYTKIQALVSRITGYMYGGCYISTLKAEIIIKKEKPDIVHIHCINGHCLNNYLFINWLKKNNYKTVLTNHAELMYTGNCGCAYECNKYQFGCKNCPRFREVSFSWFVDNTHNSWKKMKDAFEGFQSLIVTNVSPWLNNRAEQSTILKEFPHYVVCNGLDTDTFYYRNNYSKAEMVVLHVTAHFSNDEMDIKGGKYFIEIAKRFENVKNIRFVVAGIAQKDIDLPSNIQLLGKVTDQNQLAELYSKSHVVILTSKKETFSMVTAESLCCGTPVIGFKAGAPEMICLQEYCSFVEPGDVNELVNVLKAYLEKNFDKDQISKEAKEKYSVEKMARSYESIYEKLVNVSLKSADN